MNGFPAMPENQSAVIFKRNMAELRALLDQEILSESLQDALRYALDALAHAHILIQALVPDRAAAEQAHLLIDAIQ